MITQLNYEHLTSTSHFIVPFSLTPLEKDLSEVTLAVFGANGKLAGNKECFDIVRSYIPTEANDLSSLFYSFVNLSDPVVLKDHLTTSFQSSENVDLAMNIVRRIYEADKESVDPENTKFGFIFSTEPEVLSYALKYIKKQNDAIVYEIACSKGNNGMLMACAGAKKVFLNDLNKKLMTALKGQIDKLPKKLKAVCKMDEGSCFDILKRNADLEGRVNLIMCRNLIHFFNHQQLASLFELVKKMLVSGGQAIFTANSIFQNYADAKPHEKEQLAQFTETSFQNTGVFVHEYTAANAGRVNMPCMYLTAKLSPCEDELVSGTDFIEEILREKSSKTNYTWKTDAKVFASLEENLQQEVLYQLKENKAVLDQIQVGRIRVVRRYIRAYNLTSLTTLFKSHGFNVLESFMVDAKGHLIRDFYSTAGIRSAGIVVSKP